MIKKPFISVVTPTLNDIDNLKKLIKSKKQTCKNFEHIIADGGSVDGTLQYLKTIKDVDKFQYQRFKHV